MSVKAIVVVAMMVVEGWRKVEQKVLAAWETLLPKNRNCIYSRAAKGPGQVISIACTLGPGIRRWVFADVKPIY